MLTTEDRRAHNPFNMSMPSQKRRVLCIDDDADTCRMIAAVLAPEYEIVSALSAREAWHLYNDGRFSLVILDFRLDDGDGLALCERIRRQDFLTTIIFITGDPNISETSVRIAGGQRLIRKGQTEFLDQLYAYTQALSVTV